MKLIFKVALILGAIATPVITSAQEISRSVPGRDLRNVSVTNLHGRVEVLAISPTDPSNPSETKREGDLTITASSPNSLTADELSIASSGSNVIIKVQPADSSKRVDLNLLIPSRLGLKVQTDRGEVRAEGDFESIDVRTDTGTIAVDIPTEYIKYRLLWTAARPRFLSDFDLAPVRERSAGRFEIAGSFADEAHRQTRKGSTPENSFENADAKGNGKDRNEKNSRITAPISKKRVTDNNAGKRHVSLSLQTARGIILINIPPNEVTGDLRERPLTDAAKAIIRSGDSLLMEAIRRAAPKFYGDYTRTLPPIKLEPTFTERRRSDGLPNSDVRIASVRVSDENNRAIAGFTSDDFEVLENNQIREILDVRPTNAPFNLVLLLDVSGSVENYVNFIRKAARNFVETVDPRDRISVVTFNDDVNVVAGFTTDKDALSKSLDTFDAGGATAYYDALAYTLAETLRPLRGERTAIVILSDGDDNRSFLPFESMLSSIQESGALIYPLYVPSGLIAAFQNDPNGSVDSLRQRYLHGQLTSKAKDEGRRLASVSGGVYYEIERLSQIQAAYEDIVLQLRTAYDIEYRSGIGDETPGVSPRLRIASKKPNAFVQIRSVNPKPAK